MGQPRSEPHHRAQPWTEWRGAEGLSRARVLRLAQPCAGSRGDVISLPQEQTPICLTFWSGSSAASIWGWRHLGGGSWVSVAGELRTSERRGFGGLGGGMQSPGSYWRPQSRHPSVRYLFQSPVFTDAAWWVPRKQGSPAAGVGVPSPQLGIVPLPSPGLLCCLIRVACGHPCPFARSCCLLLRVATEFLLRGADGSEVWPLVPSLPGPCRLVLPECSL